MIELIKLTEIISLPCATVLSLLAACSPSAVTGFIIAIIIYAVQRETIWPRPHILKEFSKRVDPPLGNFNSTSSIVTIPWEITVKAPLFHSSPAHVGSRSNPPMFDRIRVSFESLFKKTATALGSTCSQIISHFIHISTTLTPTLDPRSSVFNILCYYG